MPTFLSLDDGMEMLNADHIDRFRIGRLSSTTPEERGNSIGYSLAGQTGIITLDGGLTLDEATAALAALAKSVAKASETHAIVDRCERKPPQNSPESYPDLTFSSNATSLRS